jgi:hypothetical protein
MKNIALIANSTGCTVVIGTKVTTVANDHPNYQAIQDAYAEGDIEAVVTLMSIRDTINTIGRGVVRVEGDQLFYGDRPVSNGLAKRIIKLLQEGREGFAKPLIAFMENVMQNPSFRAVEGLYEWLERSKLPITPDGCFIAWKIVRNDYRDHYTGKFDNSVGQVVEVARNQVNEDPNQTCSNGLHFCSNEYLPHYGNIHGGSRIMMVKVNPRDVGAFPKDYNISKGRCCRYEVIGEVTAAETETVFKDVKSGVYKVPTRKGKTVAHLETSVTDRAEIILVFTDGTKQRTKNRLGDTIGFDQNGAVVTLQPSGRQITIV